MEWRKQHVHFEETTASKTVIDKIKTHGFVILSSPTGSGKSAIAFNTAFMLEKDKEYEILPISYPEEIRRYIMQESKQVFIIGDPVGKYTVDDLGSQRWTKEKDFIKQTFTDYSTAKLLLTCRSYIYNFGFCCKLNVSPTHCNLLSNELKLSLSEREKNCKRYNIPTLNKETSMMFDFFPL